VVGKLASKLENRIDTPWSNEAIQESIVCTICCTEFPDYFHIWYNPNHFNWTRCATLLKQYCSSYKLIWEIHYVYYSLLADTRKETMKLSVVKPEVGETLLYISQAIQKSDVQWMSDINWGINSYYYI
jgi:hypothetical protein